MDSMRVTATGAGRGLGTFGAGGGTPYPIRAAMARPETDLARARDVKEAFTSFVGETFYSQLIGAMRTSLGEPAYFHGGQAEEIFRGQLDQQLAQTMAQQSADRFADPMFDRQFPALADALAREQQFTGPR